MAVQFKFRSSATFDHVNLNGRSSISVRDLKFKIAQQKNLKICQDFDLVVSDANTGKAFSDDDHTVADGSSVIVKRVPAGTWAAPLALSCGETVKRCGVGNCTGSLASASNAGAENFDDFGIDLYPLPEASFLGISGDVDENNCISSKKPENTWRCSESLIAMRQQYKLNNTCEALPKGSFEDSCNHGSAVEGNIQQNDLLPKAEQKFIAEVDLSPKTWASADLPVELKCCLCDAIFKEAVMIPCCQHSFCEKCIRLSLTKSKSCPRCCSSRCGLDDLLPNVSLRQAIEHFLESHVLTSGSDKVLLKDAPDGESRVHAVDLSCSMSALNRDPLLPHSPTATCRGSNQVLPELASRPGRENKVAGSGLLTIYSDALEPEMSNLKQSRSENSEASKTDNVPPTLSQTLVQNEDRKRKRIWFHAAGASGSSFQGSKNKRADRTCYMCGSPDHLIKSCPAACSPYPVLPSGNPLFSSYGVPFWHGANPFRNLCGMQRMMPYDPSLVPFSAFTVPPYMQPMSVYGGMQPQCYLKTDQMMPSRIAGAAFINYANYPDCSNSDGVLDLSSEHQQRMRPSNHDNSLNDHDSNEHRSRSYSQKLPANEDDESKSSYRRHHSNEQAEIHSCKRSTNPCNEDHSVRREHRRNSHHALTSWEHMAGFSKGLNKEYGMQETSVGSIPCSKARVALHKKSKTSDRSHRQDCGDMFPHCRTMDDFKKHDHRRHSFSDSDAEPSTSICERRHGRDKVPSYSSKDKIRSTDHETLKDDRWVRMDDLDREHREAHHYQHKWKRDQ